MLIVILLTLFTSRFVSFYDVESRGSTICKGTLTRHDEIMHRANAVRITRRLSFHIISCRSFYILSNGVTFTNWNIYVGSVLAEIFILYSTNKSATLEIIKRKMKPVLV